MINSVVNRSVCGVYLHYVSRQTFEVWRLWRSVDKNFSRKTSRILTSGQNVQKPAVEHKHLFMSQYNNIYQKLILYSCIKLIKSDSKTFIKLQNNYISNKCCYFKHPIHQRIMKNKMYLGFHKNMKQNCFCFQH